MLKTGKAREQVNVDLERDKKFLVDLDRDPIIGFNKKVTGVLTKKHPSKKKAR
jgi:hypothetical protein